MLAGTDLIIALLVVFLGSVVYSTVSFGMGLVIVPFLLLFVLPIEAVIIVDILIAIVAISVAFEARREIVWNKTYVLIIGAAVAIPIGAYALDVTDPTILKIVIGLGSGRSMTACPPKKKNNSSLCDACAAHDYPKQH